MALFVCGKGGKGLDAIRCAYKILDYLEQSIERSDVDYKDISAERLGVSNQMHTTVI